MVNFPTLSQTDLENMYFILIYFPYSTTYIDTSGFDKVRIRYQRLKMFKKNLALKKF